MADSELPRSNWTSLYCKAYYFRQVRAFPGWHDERINWKEPDGPLEDDQVVMVHDDFSVTVGIFHGENVLTTGRDPEWQTFAREQLRFAIPEDLRYRYERSDA